MRFVVGPGEMPAVAGAEKKGPCSASSWRKQRCRGRRRVAEAASPQPLTAVMTAERR